jgi:hypothetical protein
LPEHKSRVTRFRQPGYLILETRGFPSPPCGGFGFSVQSMFAQYYEYVNNKLIKEMIKEKFREGKRKRLDTLIWLPQAQDFD